MLNLMKKGRDLLSNSPITYLNEPDDPIYPKLYTDVCEELKTGDIIDWGDTKWMIWY